MVAVVEVPCGEWRRWPFVFRTIAPAVLVYRVGWWCVTMRAMVKLAQVAYVSQDRYQLELVGMKT